MTTSSATPAKSPRSQRRRALVGDIGRDGEIREERHVHQGDRHPWDVAGKFCWVPREMPARPPAWTRVVLHISPSARRWQVATSRTATAWSPTAAGCSKIAIVTCNREVRSCRTQGLESGSASIVRDCERRACARSRYGYRMCARPVLPRKHTASPAPSPPVPPQLTTKRSSIRSLRGQMNEAC